MLILFLYYFLLVISTEDYLTSVTIRDNKLYNIYQDSKLDHVKCRVFELKEGPIIDIINSSKTYELIQSLKGFNLVFIDTPDSSKESYNKLWVRTKSYLGAAQQKNTLYANWIGYINLDDMSLKTDSSFIKFPMFENFPMDRYTINTVTNKYGSALYITGGVISPNNDRSLLYAKSFYKYNFTSKEWIDMAYSANGKLRHFIEHRSVVIENRYLVILGGPPERSKNELESSNSERSNLIRKSLYNLTVFDTFSNNWEEVNIKPNILETSIATLQFNRFLATVYNNKIIVIGMSVGDDDHFIVGGSPFMGILDYNSKTWNWSPIYDEDGSKFNLSISALDLL
ncbi:hypothetical protein CONCODRAFT_10902, partial [Conidiobolus coronatus NRRL 28638]